MRSAVITGSTSMIGTALIELLIEKKIEVLAVTRPQSKHIKRLDTFRNQITIVECDVSKIAELPKMTIGKYDVFFHLGWTAKGRYYRENSIQQSKDIYYTLQAVNAARDLGCCTFIGAGSQAEYGPQLVAPAPDTPVDPNTAYGIAKYSAGKLSSFLCRELGIRHVWTRIYSVYGPNDSFNSMIMYTIRTLLQGEVPSLTACTQKWDYLYSTDAARALYLLGIYGKDQTVYNIGSGCALPLYDYVKTLRDSIDKSLPIGVGNMGYGDKQIMYLCANTEELSKDTGFKPQVSYEDGIVQTIKWYKKILGGNQSA